MNKKILTEILNSEISDSKEACKIIGGTYKSLEFSNLKIGDFSVSKAYKKFGFKEIPFTDADFFMILNILSGGSLGVSRSDENILVISPKCKVWKFVGLHETGHLMFGHSGSNPITTLKHCSYGENVDAGKEIEADLFAYFVIKKLGIEESLAVAGEHFQVWKNAGFNFNLMTTTKAEKLADEFIAAGRGN